MKKIFVIFVTVCTIVGSSASLSDVAAQTAGKFDVKLSGDAFITAGWVQQRPEEAGRDVEVMNRFRLRVTATATANNGLTYGASMRLRTSLRSGVADADVAYLFAKGRFGTVELGTQFNPNLLYHVMAPSGFGTGGVDGDWMIGDVGWVQYQLTFLEPYFGGGYTVTTFVKEANKINYLTPRFFSDGAPQRGLMGTLSYTPTNRAVYTNVNRVLVNTDSVNSRPYGAPKTNAYSNCLGGTSPLGCNYTDIYELGLRYDESFHDITLAGNFSYIGGTTQRINFGVPRSFYDLSAWQAGVQLGYRGWLIGGSYLDAGRSAYPRPSAATGRLYPDGQSTWTAGVSFETGPLTVGCNYQHGRDAGDLTVPGARFANLYAVGMTYQLAPGLTTALEYMHSTTHNEPGYARDALGVGPNSSGNANMLLWKTQVTF